MKLLKAVKFHGLFRLWNVQEKKVTDALFFSELLRCIGNEEKDWDPGVFEWYHQEDINFADWQEMKIHFLPFVINDQG
ncbi:hypothetical protein [Domibacillus mangrovi]|uniref:Uncharacterized protein n=1 Tax=Domibacillus mangrovi TaxID=1714354 RepID=A0A1Q5NZP6_9BACI|nr:hypothetical protein [Domibacillus mangrovi]OKL35487.1 hypothetical protein BLL40_15120 [Domibacillus mangrovi]